MEHENIIASSIAVFSLPFGTQFVSPMTTTNYMHIFLSHTYSTIWLFYFFNIAYISVLNPMCNNIAYVTYS